MLRVTQACISTVDEAVEACRRIGYPSMLKASWGGGGKGIRKVCVRRVHIHCVGKLLNQLPRSIFSTQPMFLRAARA